ncbi:MAG: prepilin-type N-terminal cleavage/methylation domain-containing protein [Gemmatimonadaceae bacterium]|nr:prepilin-type N-terminal cleavage/methylation domain-containing protein [Gemmatimonadaceae bacterium]
MPSCRLSFLRRSHRARRSLRISVERSTRAGITLFELLLVLFIIGIVAAALVRLQLPASVAGLREKAPNLDRLIDSARTLAAKRAVTVGLRVYDDGLWSIVIPGESEPLAVGRMAEESTQTAQLPVLLTVDPLGSCRPDSRWWVSREGTATVWDAARCRWRLPSPNAGTGGRGS